MQDGEIGLYRHEDGTIYCNIRKGDEGLALERLLPPAMRGTAFDDAPVMGFLRAAYHFFATHEQWDQLWAEAEPALRKAAGGKVNLPSPALDLQALELENEHGEIDYAQLEQLYTLIWPYWEQSPPVGLIAHLIADGRSFKEIAGWLALFAHYGDKIEHMVRC